MANLDLINRFNGFVNLSPRYSTEAESEEPYRRIMRKDKESVSEPEPLTPSTEVSSENPSPSFFIPNIEKILKGDFQPSWMRKDKFNNAFMNSLNDVIYDPSFSDLPTANIVKPKPRKGQIYLNDMVKSYDKKGYLGEPKINIRDRDRYFHKSVRNRNSADPRARQVVFDKERYKQAFKDLEYFDGNPWYVMMNVENENFKKTGRVSSHRVNNKTDMNNGFIEWQGITEKSHPKAAREIDKLMKSGKYDEAKHYIANYMEGIGKDRNYRADLIKDPGVRFMVNDFMFNSSPKGVKRTLERVPGIKKGSIPSMVKQLNDLGDPLQVIQMLAQARAEFFGELSMFPSNPGLANRLSTLLAMSEYVYYNQ